MLTRLPGGLAVAPEAAAAVLDVAFRDEPLQLTAAERRTLLSTLAAAGVGGGASYDGLVALEATAHEQRAADARRTRPGHLPPARRGLPRRVA